MLNLKDFVNKAIGATFILRIIDGDPDQRDTFKCVIDSIIEQDDCSYNVITTDGYEINVPSLEVINDMLDGKPFEKINTLGYKMVLKCI